MYRVLIPQEIDPAGIALLRENGCEPVFCAEDAVAREIQNCEGCVSKTLFLREEWLADAPRLRVVGKHGAGWDNVIDLAAARRQGVTVVYTPCANANAVAEHALALILALAKRLPEMRRAARAGNMAYPDTAAPREVRGAVLGLVGVGRIGSLVAQKAVGGLGMRAVGYDPLAPGFPPHVRRLDTAEALFEQSDYISLHLPGGEATRGAIGRELIARMKPDAFLINCARGSVVDQEALAEALGARRIAGAALDVYEPEPLPPGHPLLTMDNVLLTPHSAALTAQALRLMSLQACEGVADVLQGRTPRWVARGR